MDKSTASGLPLSDVISNETAKLVRERLSDIFTELWLLESVLIVCMDAAEGQAADHDLDVSLVLRRLGANALHEQLHKLSDVIEALGGATELSEMDDEDQDDDIDDDEDRDEDIPDLSAFVARFERRLRRSIKSLRVKEDADHDD